MDDKSEIQNLREEVAQLRKELGEVRALAESAKTAAVRAQADIDCLKSGGQVGDVLTITGTGLPGWEGK